MLLSSYEELWTERSRYPATVSFMLCYFGVHIYSVNSQYENAEKYCQRLFDLIVKYKSEEYFIIYLLLKIKLKTNLCEWQESLKCLTKLLFFSWLYSLTNLEIWCYFEFSRAYFFIQKEKEAELFRCKSENNTVQPKKSIYREVCVNGLTLEILDIWEGKLDFVFNTTIESGRLQLSPPEKYEVEEYIADQRKLKSSIKHISQECRIRHVGNLLSRVS